MNAWGFSYRSCLTWIKPRLGLGQYLRNQTEHLLLGIRGRAPIQFRSQGSWFYAPMQEQQRQRVRELTAAAMTSALAGVDDV